MRRGDGGRRSRPAEGSLGSCGDRNITDQKVLRVDKYSHRMVPEIFQTFWAGMATGEFITDATAAAGTFTKQGTRWLADCGGVRPRRGRNLKGRCLTFAEREEIALGIAAGHSLRDIAKVLNRNPSTISREIARNRESSGRYRGQIGARGRLPPSFAAQTVQARHQSAAAPDGGEIPRPTPFARTDRGTTPTRVP
jgi:hypothetical protein